ncbi:MAG: SGNH/GDSL hydrolase family protein [Longimicrobiales bacterium]
MTPDPLPFLALGDSYTIGEGVDSALRWPVHLARRLRDAGIPVEDPLIIARTGWTTDELDAGIDEAGPEGPFALVSLLVGVNNQYRGREVEEYRGQFQGLLARAIGLAGGDPGRILVLSIPDWGVMPFAEGRDRAAISDKIDRFNRVGREECNALGVAYVNVTGISREAASDPALAAEDGLHPSGLQYGLWADAAFPEAMRILEGISR